MTSKESGVAMLPRGVFRHILEDYLAPINQNYTRITDNTQRCKHKNRFDCKLLAPKEFRDTSVHNPVTGFIKNIHQCSQGFCP